MDFAISFEKKPIRVGDEVTSRQVLVGYLGVVSEIHSLTAVMVHVRPEVVAGYYLPQLANDLVHRRRYG